MSRWSPKELESLTRGWIEVTLSGHVADARQFWQKTFDSFCHHEITRGVVTTRELSNQKKCPGGSINKRWVELRNRLCKFHNILQGILRDYANSGWTEKDCWDLARKNNYKNELYEKGKTVEEVESLIQSVEADAGENGPPYQTGFTHPFREELAYRAALMAPKWIDEIEKEQDDKKAAAKKRDAVSTKSSKSNKHNDQSMVNTTLDQLDSHMFDDGEEFNKLRVYRVQMEYMNIKMETLQRESLFMNEEIVQLVNLSKLAATNEEREACLQELKAKREARQSTEHSLASLLAEMHQYVETAVEEAIEASKAIATKLINKNAPPPQPRPPIPTYSGGRPSYNPFSSTPLSSTPMRPLGSSASFDSHPRQFVFHNINNI